MSRARTAFQRRGAAVSALGALALTALGACADGPTVPATRAPDADASTLAPSGQVINYDFATLGEYLTKWSNIYGPGELAVGGTRDVKNGAIRVSAIPFRTAYDFSVYDHLKYIAISNESFAVPAVGSLTFAVDIEARTPGASNLRTIHGCYGGAGSYQAVGDPCAKTYTGKATQGQQAGVVLNMINFATGQLFDWFVSDNQVFALIERLPSNVTGAGTVGLDRAYTQIVKVGAIPSGGTHNVAIRYTRGFGVSRVEYFLDGKSFAAVDNVGVPLDVQGVKFSGTYPSYGPGEVLNQELDSFQIGHGLFSLLDAFPYQHPDRPDLSVSIPISERAFGQGASGSWKNFRVITN